MSAASPAFPRYRPVADHAVLVEFGETIARETHDCVRRLDAALARKPFAGFTEAVPAYCSVLVGFDPVVSDHALAEAALRVLAAEDATALPEAARREVLVCYDAAFAPDLAEVATLTGLTPDAVIAAHLAGDYSVFMYGFAPGYAYLAGTPPTIQLPRKSAAVRGVAAGSVMIAGPQSLVTTLVMPTGWWIIGRSPTRILRQDEERPFLFDIGDGVSFRRIDRAAFDLAEKRD